MRLLFSSIFGIIGLVLLVVGCPLMGIAAGLYYFVDSSTSDWVLVSGTVTAMNERESYNSDVGTYQTSYCPTVAFATQDGQSLELDLDECSTPPAYNVGDSVEIYYNPAEPHQVQMKGGVKEVVGNTFAVVLAVIGGALSCGGIALAIGAVAVVLMRRKAASAPASAAA